MEPVKGRIFKQNYIYLMFAAKKFEYAYYIFSILRISFTFYDPAEY